MGRVLYSLLYKAVPVVSERSVQFWLPQLRKDMAGRGGLGEG